MGTTNNLTFLNTQNRSTLVDSAEHCEQDSLTALGQRGITNCLTFLIVNLLKLCLYQQRIFLVMMIRVKYSIVTTYIGIYVERQ